MLPAHPTLLVDWHSTRTWFALHNKTYDLEFVGDSTMRNLFQAFQMVLGCTPRPDVSIDRCRASGTRIQFRRDAYCQDPPTDHEGVRIVGCGLWFLNPEPFAAAPWNRRNMHNWFKAPALQARACKGSRACIIAINHRSCSNARKPCARDVNKRVCEKAQRTAYGASVLRNRSIRIHTAAHRCPFDPFSRCDRNVEGDYVHFHLDLFTELRSLLTTVDASSSRCDATA